MADQNENDRNIPRGDENQGSRDQEQNRKAGSPKSGQEQDDVAEDRNLSGASTWLTLPDEQPSGDDQSSGGSSSNK